MNGEFTKRQQSLLDSYDTLVKDVAEATGQRSSIHIAAEEFGEYLHTLKLTEEQKSEMMDCLLENVESTELVGPEDD